MKTRKTLLWLPLMVLIGACGENEGNDTSAAGSRATPVSSASCIADYAQRPCELLTAELARSVYADLPVDAQTEQTLGTSSCQHSWPGERTQQLKFGGLEVEVPLNNRVAISWIARKDGDGAEEWFRHVYRSLSDEEKAAAQDAFEQELEERTAGLSEDQKALAGSFGRDMINASRYENVSGVGTAAAWDAGPRGYTLKVLDGDTEFGIEADISADSDVNRDLAIALARAVIASCP